MKVVSLELSRVTRLLSATRLAGQLYLPRAISDFLNSYQFVEYPTDLTSMVREKIEFKMGEFKDTAIDSFEIYNDGIVVSARSKTDIIDEFIDDVVSYMKESWGVSFFETQLVVRSHESSLIVESERNLLDPLTSYQTILQGLSDGLHASNGMRAEFEALGVGFAVDPNRVTSAIKPTAFRLERRLASDFHFNHYVTSAPLRTSDHIRLLEHIEALSGEHPHVSI